MKPDLSRYSYKTASGMKLSFISFENTYVIAWQPSEPIEGGVVSKALRSVETRINLFKQPRVFSDRTVRTLTGSPMSKDLFHPFYMGREIDSRPEGYGISLLLPTLKFVFKSIFFCY